MADCSDGIYLSEGGQTLFEKHFLPLVIVLPVSVVIGCSFGILGIFKCSYKVIALMSTGVVTKLALIPDVDDDVEKEEKKKGCLQKKKSIVFKTPNGPVDKAYGVFPVAPMCFLSLAPLLILAYASVLITAQWKFTTKCIDVLPGEGSLTHYNGLHRCPPVNCTAWNDSKMNEVLIRISNSTAFDPFNPLERFVSLLAVQVAVLQFFACIINKGCHSRLSYPPCRYTIICVFDFLFVLVVSGVTAYIGTTQIDRHTTFQSLTIPFIHLIFVSIAECLVLFVFVCLLWCNKCCSPPSSGVRNNTSSSPKRKEFPPQNHEGKQSANDEGVPSPNHKNPVSPTTITSEDVAGITAQTPSGEEPSEGHQKESDTQQCTDL